MVNKTTLENIATNEVKTKLNYTGFIDTSYIKEGDKEPVWDGNIYVYKSKEIHSLDQLLHKIPVQIKGTTNELEKKQKFRIKVNELELYLRDGGVLYFVVRINTVTRKNQIYYIYLLPYNLKQAIQQAEKHKSIEIEIQMLPEKDEDIMEVICDFAQHRQMQQGYIHFKKPSVLNFNAVSIPVTKVGNNFNMDKFLLNYGGFCYGSDKDGTVYPFMVQKGSIIRREERPDIITVGGKKFFSHLVRKVSIDQDILILNDNLEFVCANSTEGVCNIQYKGSLSKCITSLEFVIQVGKVGEFSINGISKHIKIDEKNISILEKNLEFLYKLKKTLDKCNIYKEFQTSNFTEEDKLNINILIWTIGEGHEIELDTNIDTVPYNIKINHQTILCVAEKQNNGKYLLSPFSSNVKFGKEDLLLSPYTYLGEVFLENVINIKKDEILTDIQKYGIDDVHLNVANRTGLTLLSVYDKTKEIELLMVAKNIFQWIKDHAEGESKILYYLNVLQCDYRISGNINEEDIDYLHDIIEDNYDAKIKYGAYVLLKDYKGANRQFNRLKEPDKETMKQYPIYNLWKELNNG